MERVYETAVNLMHIPTNCDQQEQIEKENNGFYMGRTRWNRNFQSIETYIEQQMQYIVVHLLDN